MEQYRQVELACGARTDSAPCVRHQEAQQLHRYRAGWVAVRNHGGEPSGKKWNNNLEE